MRKNSNSKWILQCGQLKLHELTLKTYLQN